MKKYKFKINGNSYQIDIRETSGNLIQLEVNGTPYEVLMETEIKTSKTPVLIRTEPRPTLKVESLKTTELIKNVLSPLPGIILEIFVKEGDVVKTGDKLLILEAMKMENMIMSESSGTIRSIKVQPKSIVLQGDLLLEII